MNRALVAISAAAIVAGILSVENPLRERHRRADDMREDNLQLIAGLVTRYKYSTNALPTSVEQAAASENMNVPRDPETGDRYAYSRVSDTKYALCASFRLEAKDVEPGYHSEFVNHPAGYHCFSLAVKPKADQFPDT
jgi:hypothetical protein